MDADTVVMATCDCCAEGMKSCRFEGGDPNGAYICEDCAAVHERALDAATDAVMEGYALFRDPRYGTELVRSEVREIVALAVKAFIEHDGEERLLTEGGDGRGVD